ncbi:MAG: hypothetical protein MJ162_07515 [Treponema sp.]|nr:hypothetical protein [Treponema sp.]
MKFNENNNFFDTIINRWKKLSLLNQILYLIIVAILCVIIFTTIFAAITKKISPGKNYRNADPLPTEKTISNLNKKSDETVAAYTGIGTIRAITAASPEAEDEMGTPLVVTPWFTYPEGDTVFFEELSRKRILITGIITNYFLQYTEEQLLSFSEEKIKADLLELINSQLSLGKISRLYFTDYIFL